jgi:hypothetical protein
MDQTKRYLFSIGVLSLLLLTVSEHVRAQNCVLAPTQNQGATQSCPPVTQIEVLGSGFTWGFFPPAGPYVQFSIPHSVLTSPAPYAINQISSFGCSTIPFPGSVFCSAEVALEFLMWTQADQGQGVITNFYWDGVFAGYWSFSPIPASNCLTAPPPVLHAGGDWCNVNSDCQSGMCMQVICNNNSTYCQHHECLCPTAQCLGNSPYVNIQTQKGFFLTAAGGGGIGGGRIA